MLKNDGRHCQKTTLLHYYSAKGNASQWDKKCKNMAGFSCFSGMKKSGSSALCTDAADTGTKESQTESPGR